MVRVLLVGLIFVALSGCWVGRNLYSPSDARTVIPPGAYQATGPGAPKRLYRVSILPNGLTQLDGGEKKEVYGFSPLEHDVFVGWVQVEDAGPEDDNQLYGLLVRQSGSVFMVYAPECRDEQAEIARKSGARIETDTSPVCHFPTRASLEKAMRLMPRDPASALRLERIP